MTTDSHHLTVVQGERCVEEVLSVDTYDKESSRSYWFSAFATYMSKEVEEQSADNHHWIRILNSLLLSMSVSFHLSVYPGHSLRLRDKIYEPKSHFKIFPSMYISVICVCLSLCTSVSQNLITRPRILNFENTFKSQNLRSAKPEQSYPCSLFCKNNTECSNLKSHTVLPDLENLNIIEKKNGR